MPRWGVENKLVQAVSACQRVHTIQSLVHAIAAMWLPGASYFALATVLACSLSPSFTLLIRTRWVSLVLKPGNSDFGRLLVIHAKAITTKYVKVGPDWVRVQSRLQRIWGIKQAIAYDVSGAMGLAKRSPPDSFDGNFSTALK